MPGKMVVILGASNILWIMFAASQAFKIETTPESRYLAQIGDSVSLTCSTTGSFPKDPEIHLSGPLEAGKPITVKCSVADVYPFDRLEIDLLKGDHLMKSQEFLEDADRKSLETKSLEVTFTPVIEDIGKVLVCRAKLHIDEMDSVPTERQAVKELQVYKKPFTVEISPGPRIAAQIGDSVMLTCSVMGCESPSFSWRTQIDSPLSGKVRSEGTNSTLTLSPVSFENEHSYLCTVTCGHKKLEKGIQVELYSFPRDPEIEMSGDLVNGSSVTVSCKVPSVYPLDRLEIELLKGETILKNIEFLEDTDMKSLENKSLEMTFIPTIEDTGKALVCQAKLHIDDMEFEPKQRQSTQTLYVNVAPRDTIVLVSPSSILEEGSSVNMTCLSQGFPAPKILWSRQLPNGELQPLSENATLTLISTKMEDSGVYLCEGINQAGRSRKEVELIIQVTPKDIKLTAFPSESVKEGDTVIISCTCGNVPETWIILKKKAETGDTVLKSIDGAYTIRKAQLKDAGVYECESKNKVGSQLRSLTLDVQGRENSKDYFSPELLVLYFASSLVIPAIGMIIYFARKANMKGSYSLVEAQKSKV
ncbi:VCAM1 isoform 1 [Pan troglodytes]|uniref:Vascular cell adhesion protein 1 n=1 Tax=Pan troglodytes TaxID=9598 RepID=A0A2J8MHN8_PANTR|nr:VCAM1 isoform 1 [Pan troglodytes]